MKIIVFGLMVWVNTQWAGVAILEPYRSWSVEYSYGQTINAEHRWINLWHWPIFSHCDVEAFLRNLQDKACEKCQVLRTK